MIFCPQVHLHLSIGGSLRINMEVTKNSPNIVGNWEMLDKIKVHPVAFSQNFLVKQKYRKCKKGKLEIVNSMGWRSGDYMVWIKPKHLYCPYYVGEVEKRKAGIIGKEGGGIRSFILGGGGVWTWSKNRNILFHIHGTW